MTSFQNSRPVGKTCDSHRDQEGRHGLLVTPDSPRRQPSGSNRCIRAGASKVTAENREAVAQPDWATRAEELMLELGGSVCELLYIHCDLTK